MLNEASSVMNSQNKRVIQSSRIWHYTTHAWINKYFMDLLSFV